jgi:hypothetical protein
VAVVNGGNVFIPDMNAGLVRQLTRRGDRGGFEGMLQRKLRIGINASTGRCAFAYGADPVSVGGSIGG